MKRLDDSGEKCGCRAIFAGPPDALFDEFCRVRDRCPALRQVLIPDDLWDEFCRLHAEPPDEKRHCSIMVLAYGRGCLARITVPVHRFLLEGDQIAGCVDQDYRGRSRETWTSKQDIRARHDRSRDYQGFIHELLFAEHLCQRGWKIENLAAWGGPHDVEAAYSQNGPHAFEVKFIGEDDEMFLAGGGAFTLEKRSDYLLLRVYQAACQLRRAEDSKHLVAVVVLGLMTKGKFKMAFKKGVVPWGSPKFYHKESDWKEFFTSEILPKCPHIEQDLASCLRAIDEVWLLFESEGFTHEGDGLVIPTGAGK